MSSPNDYRSELVTRLRGQTVRVPELLLIFHDWTARKHPDAESLRVELEAFYQVHLPTAQQRLKAHKADLALFTSLFWSRVSKEKLVHFGQLSGWILMWDDEVDCGSLTHDCDGTSAYIDASATFLRHHLQPELNSPLPATGRLHNCGPWVELARAMQTGQTAADRDRFANSLYAYFEAVRASAVQRAVAVQELDAYVERRAKNVASELCLTVLPWAYGLALPAWIW
jgi:hypothetical protein